MAGLMAMVVIISFLGMAFNIFTDGSAKTFAKYDLMDKYMPWSMFFFSIPNSVIKKEIKEQEDPLIIEQLQLSLRKRKRILIFLLICLASFFIGPLLQLATILIEIYLGQ